MYWGGCALRIWHFILNVRIWGFYSSGTMCEMETCSLISGTGVAGSDDVRSWSLGWLYDCAGYISLEFGRSQESVVGWGAPFPQPFKEPECWSGQGLNYDIPHGSDKNGTRTKKMARYG